MRVWREAACGRLYLCCCMHAARGCMAHIIVRPNLKMHSLCIPSRYQLMSLNGLRGRALPCPCAAGLVMNALMLTFGTAASLLVAYQVGVAGVGATGLRNSTGLLATASWAARLCVRAGRRTGARQRGLGDCSSVWLHHPQRPWRHGSRS